MPKLLFVTKTPFYPDSSGGAQQSSLYLFKSLQQRGWQIEVICGLSLNSPYFRRAWQQLHPSIVLTDKDLGYPCWRRLNLATPKFEWLRWLNQRLQSYQPDIVLGHSNPKCPLLNHTASLGYPSFYFVRNLVDIGGSSVISGAIQPIANSPFTASVVAKHTHRDVPVVLPFMDLDRYKVVKRDRKYITFINPVPEKGVKIATEVARRLPNERFLFVKGKWAIFSEKQVEEFLQPARQLPNVEIWEHQWDMSRVYEVADVLLVPSQFVETFGRVIVEAQVSSIPVVAANVGGISYTLGQGGIVIDPKDDPQKYAEAIQQLRTDESYYLKLSTAALENSQRPEFDPQYQIERFIDFTSKEVKQLT